MIADGPTGQEVLVLVAGDNQRGQVHAVVVDVLAINHHHQLQVGRGGGGWLVGRLGHSGKHTTQVHGYRQAL